MAPATSQAEDARTEAKHLLERSAMVDDAALADHFVAQAQVWATLAVSLELSSMAVA